MANFFGTTGRVCHRDEDDGMEWKIPCQENRDVTEMLGRERANTQMERNWRIQLQQELLENSQKLERQKSLKEMYINREKQTRQDLERLQKYSKPETLSTTSIASQVNNTIKQKKKKDLHNDYEELKVAHMISDHKFTIALQDKKEKNQVLQEELDRLRASNQEISKRYEDQILTARQEVDDLKRELEKEIKSRAEDKLLMQNFMAEQEAPRQKMEEQTRLLHEEAAKKEMFMQRKVEELTTKLNVQLSLKEEFQEHHALDPSLWKRTRNLLGLRKPKKLKSPNNHAPNNRSLYFVEGQNDPGLGQEVKNCVQNTVVSELTEVIKRHS